MLSISVALAAGAAALAQAGCALPPAEPPAPLVLADVPSPFAIAVDATTVYVSRAEVGPLLAIPRDGGLTSSLNVRARAKAVAVDEQSLYWSDGTGVFRCDKSHCDASTVTLAPDDAGTVVVAAGTVYWSTVQDASGRARVMKAEAGAPPVEIATGNWIGGLAVDERNVYWLEQEEPYRGIMTAPIDGGAAVLLATPEPYQPDAIALGASDVYFTTSEGKLFVVSKRGGPSRVLLSNLYMSPLGLATDGTNLYLTANTTVLSLPAQGGPVTLLARGLGWPTGIAVDATSVYIADDGGNAVVKVPK